MLLVHMFFMTGMSVRIHMFHAASVISSAEALHEYAVAGQGDHDSRMHS
jgi:hypothetical protein